jgi:hypothetical protein
MLQNFFRNCLQGAGQGGTFPVFLALGSLRQEKEEFKANLETL